MKSFEVVKYVTKAWRLGMATATAAAVSLWFAGCDDPDAAEPEPRTGIITGTVLYAAAPPSSNPCTPGPVRGNAVLFLFDENRLPPPQGTSEPVNFVVIPAAQLFDSPSGAGSSPDFAPGTAGLFTAPFTIPTVPEGRYQIRGFIDADGDFNPVDPLSNQPTAGDVVGGYVDRETERFLTVVVKTDEVTSQVTVTLARPLPVERPAFALSSTTTFDVPFANPFSLTLRSHVPASGSTGGSSRAAFLPACTQFVVQYADQDGDGVPEDADGDHLVDVYPRVLLRRLDGGADETIVVPGVVNPFPFIERLAQAPIVVTDSLEVIIPPIAVRIASSGQTTKLPTVPAGAYEVSVLSGTGQTWTVPNDLGISSELNPNPDPTQSEGVLLREGRALSVGRIQGSLTVVADEAEDAFVAAFRAEDPPPPTGSGRPVALTLIPRENFAEENPSRRRADFVLEYLDDGPYLLTAFSDAGRDFSPLIELMAQPGRGDIVMASLATVEVISGREASVVQLEASRELAGDRPVFAFAPVSAPQNATPFRFELEPKSIDTLGVSQESARPPVSFAGGDEDGDGLPDLYPRVVLSLLEPSGDARLAVEQTPSIVIFGIVDPLPFWTALDGGAPLVWADKLPIIIPPYAIDRATGQPVLPVPSGRYRVHVLSSTGQTWAVPNALDFELGRDGTPAADETQARYVEINPSGVPAGVIAGEVQLPRPPTAADYQVIISAQRNFSSAAPWDVLPIATTVVPKSRFGSKTSAPYRLVGLPTGSYRVVAFLDANHDFVPWYSTRRQPNESDVGGAHLDPSTGRYREVRVDALGSPATGVTVNVMDAARFQQDPPAFILEAGLVLQLSRGSVSATVASLSAVSPVLAVDGRFAVQWADLDGDGAITAADDFDLDGRPDVFPLVYADLLDASDPAHERLSSDRVRILGHVDPEEFGPLGFPAKDPTQVNAAVVARAFTVTFPTRGVREDAPRTLITPPAGRYRVTLVNGRGQSWSVPNELSRATGSPYEASQGAHLVVRP